MPIRVDRDLFDAASSTGAAHSRSAAQQLSHWARIGREFEAASKVSQRDIERVLAGDGSYDRLAENEQAIVRAVWDERVAQRIAALNYETEFRARGESWSTLDDKGRVIEKS